MAAWASGRLGLAARLLLLLSAAAAAAAAEEAAACSAHGTPTPDGSCACDVGYGGVACDLHLATGARAAPAPAPKPLSAQEAEVVPNHMRNLLEFAENLGSAEAGPQSVGAATRRSHTDPNSGIGCGFYDAFYEGCSPCFYSDVACSPEDPFYDFYKGELAHAPVTEYTEAFESLASLSTARGPGRSAPVWAGASYAIATTPKGENYLGGLGLGDAVTLELDGMPAADATVTVSMDLLLVGGGSIDVAPGSSPAHVELVGEAGGKIPPVSTTLMPTYLLGVPHYQLTFSFAYTKATMKMKLSAGLVGDASVNTWGVDNLLVSTHVVNYAPTTEDRYAYTSADEQVTIELRSHDNECGATTTYITSLPTDGLVYLCTCDSIWTTPITADMLPAAIPGPCHRVVYAPQPNAPAASDVTRSPFDSFSFISVDEQKASSAPGSVFVFVEKDVSDTPVAGAANYAAHCDGTDDVLTFSHSANTTSVAPSFAVEARFKVLGTPRGATLIEKSGSYRIGWAERAGFQFEVMGAAGSAVATSGMDYSDRAFHHVIAYYDGSAAHLYIDGSLAASSAPMPGSNKAPLNDAAVSPTVCNGGSASAAKTAFHGYVDEVRLWSGVEVTPTAVTQLFKGVPSVTGLEPGLVAYVSFMEGGAAAPFAYDRTPARNDLQMGRLAASTGFSDGVASRYPTFAGSTAVFGNEVTLTEDTSATIELLGGDNEGGVQFFVATMPMHGTLHYADADGVMQEVVSTPVGIGSATSVVYTPAANGAGAPYDIFKYQTYDGVEFSYRQGVLVHVVGVNDMPRSYAQSVVMTANDLTVGVKLIELQGDDVDGDAVTFEVTTLPDLGSLYQVAEDGSVVGKPLGSAGVTVTHSKGVIAYVPLQNAKGTLDGAPYDTFAYVVRDASSVSAEAAVSVFALDTGLVQPVAGASGFALLFDGSDDAVELGAVGDLFPSLAASRRAGHADDAAAVQAFSIELYFKTQAASALEGRTLVDLAPFALHFTPNLGLVGMAGKAVAATSLGYNDGVWHYVSMSYNGTELCVDVDASARACVPAAGVALDAGAKAVLGARADGSAYYSGQVDELTVWDYARTREQVASDMQLPKAGCNAYATATYFAAGAEYASSLPAALVAPPLVYLDFNEGLGGTVSSATCPPKYVDAHIALTPSGRESVGAGGGVAFGFTAVADASPATPAFAASLGLGGAAGSSPAFLTSSAPILDDATVKERVPTLIRIPVSSEDGNEYGACLLETVATGGTLYFKDAATQGVGEPIPYPLPYPVYLGGKEVYFLSDENLSTEEVSGISFLFFACDDQVFYGADLSDRMMRPVMRSGDFYDAPEAAPGTEEGFAHQSFVKQFQIEVQPSNFAPVACTALEPCSLALAPEDTLARVPFTLPAFDRNGRDPLVARITFTPQHGSLRLPTGELVVPGMEVAVPPRGKAAAGGAELVYVPKPHIVGFAADTFGFHVTDGQFRTEPNEFSFDIEEGSVRRGAMASAAISGDSGMALAFSGKGQVATFGDAQYFGLGPGSSFGLYFKTASAMGVGAKLAVVGPLSLSFDDLEDALTLHCGASTKVSTKANFNDGLWHFVAASCNATTAELMVDGASYGTAPMRAYPLDTPACSDYAYTNRIFGGDLNCKNLGAYGFCAHPAFGPLISGLCPVSCNACSRAFEDKQDMVRVWRTQNPTAPASCAQALGTSYTADTIYRIACPETLPSISGEISLGNAAAAAGPPDVYGFQGEVDEFVVRSGGSAAELTEAMYTKKMPLDSELRGLFGYYRFNQADGGAIVNESPLHRLMGLDLGPKLGVSGVVASTPSRTPSTVYDYGNVVVTPEDTAATVSLKGFSSLAIEAMITKLPKHGKVTVGGGAAVHTTTKLAFAENAVTLDVTYTPNAHYSGKDSFTYVVVDASGASNPTIVALEVTPTADRPTAEPVTATVDFKEASAVSVGLSGADTSLPAQKVEYVVTFLPTHGVLSRADGSRVAAAGAVVDRTVTYKPTLNDATSDAFGYVVRNEDGMVSDEALVVLDGSAGSATPAQFGAPVAGDAGFAVRFASGTKAVFGSPSAYGLGAADGVSVSVSFKHNRDLYDTTFATIGPAIELGLSKAIGMYLRVGGKTAATYERYNDGAWHTLTATVAPDAITLAVASTTATVALDASEALAAAAEEAIVFGGADVYADIDELRIGGAGGAVAAYYRMNEETGDALSSEVPASPAGALGEAGAAAPERVTSTLPLPEKVVTLPEDTAVAIKLNGYGPDAAVTSDSPNVVVTALPSSGTLSYATATTAAGRRSANMHTISAAPFALPHGIDTVHFTPAANEHSSAPGAVYATFVYTVEHAVVAGVTSYPVSVHVVVDAAHDRPVLAHPGHVFVNENEPATISLAGLGSTIEGGPLTYIVTALPLHGSLYVNGVEATGPGTEVPAPYDVRYEPPLNVNGAPYASLGFAVTDGVMTSEIAVVDVHIEGNSAIDMKTGGASIKFVSLPPADLSGDFTVEAWVKLDGAADADLGSTVFTLVDSVSSKLAVAANTTAEHFLTALQWPAKLYFVGEAGFAMRNDRWYHVAFVLSNSRASGVSMTSGKYLYVDGLMVAAAATLPSGAAAPTGPGAAMLTIGSDAEGSSKLPGMLDELAVWSKALLHHEVVASMATRLTGSEEGLAAYLGFEETGLGVADCQDQNVYATSLFGMNCTALSRPNFFSSRDHGLCSGHPYTPLIRGICAKSCANCANWLNDKEGMLSLWRQLADPNSPETCAEAVGTTREADNVFQIACAKTLDTWHNWNVKSGRPSFATTYKGPGLLEEPVQGYEATFHGTEAPRLVKTHVPTTAGRARFDYEVAPLVAGYGAVGSAGYALVAHGGVAPGMHFKMAGVTGTCGACTDHGAEAALEFGHGCDVAATREACASDGAVRTLCPLSCDATAGTCGSVYGQDSPAFAASKFGQSCRDILGTDAEDSAFAAMACPVTLGLCVPGGDLPAYTVEFWVRSAGSDAVAAGVLRFSGLRVTIDKATGLTASVGDGAVSTEAVRNDGAWRHVAVSVEHVPGVVNYPAVDPGSYDVRVFVDGSLAAAGKGSYVTPAGDLALGYDGFDGELDNVAVHAGAVSDFARRFEGYAEPYPASLLAFFPFDNAGTGSAPTDAVTGAAAERPGRDQKYFVSSAPVGTPQLQTPEDMPIAIELMSSDGDGDRLTTTLVSLPATGALSLPTGEAIAEVPFALPCGAALKACPKTVVYHPPEDFNGVVTFNYVASDGYSESPEAVIALRVMAVNDVPVVAPRDVSVTVNTPVVIDLQAMVTDADAEDTSHTFRVAALPESGHLHYYSAAGVVGAKITDVDGALTSSRIVYVSGYNRAGDDVFSVKALDAFASSREAEVRVSVLDNDASGDLPVAGAAGNALHFAAGGTVEVGVPAAVSSAAGETAVTVWFRSGSPTKSVVDILTAHAGDGSVEFKVALSRVGTTLEFASGEKARVMYLLNDGNWHQLTVTTGGSLVVDEHLGEAASLRASAGLASPAANPASFTVGAGKGHSLLATVDELRVYSVAACGAACRAAHADSITPETGPGLLFRESFDGPAASAASAAAATESSAPLGSYVVEAYEDHPVTVALLGLPAGDVLYEIVELPEHGRLVDPASGAAVEYVPYLLAGSEVTLVPDANVAARMGFAYDCAHKATMRRSNVQRVVVDVVPQNDYPVLDAVSDATAQGSGAVFVTFRATDVDASETLSVRLTHLPALGRVFLESGEEVTDAGVALAAADTGGATEGRARTVTGTVRYVPDADASAYDEVLSFVASDSSGLHSKVQSATVSVSPAAPAAPRAFGVAQLSGFAAKLTHGSHLSAPLAGALDLSAGVSIDMYVRTTLASPAGAVLAAVPGVFALGFADSAVPTVEFAVSGTEGAATSGSAGTSTGVAAVTAKCGVVQNEACGALNDGAWHRVTATFDAPSATATLYLDSAAVATATFAQGPAAFGALRAADPPTLLVGAGVAGAEKPARAYAGAVDELKLFAAAVSDADVFAMQGVVPSGDEAGLVAYYDFNDETGDGASPTAFAPTAGSLPSAGLAAGGSAAVEVVSSYCPVYMRRFATYETAPLDVALAGSLGAHDTDPAALSFYVTTLPTSGTLHTEVNGTLVAISHVPHAVPTRSVRYVAAAEAQQVHVVRFTYGTMVGADAASSHGDDAVVEITVTHPNHPPAMEAARYAARASSGAVTKVFFGATDVDGDALTYHITTLPAYGTVYELDASTGALGDPVMAAGAVLPGPAIAYVADEVLGAALEPPVARDVLSTVVGVQASDGKLTSQEALVDFAFLAEADYEAKPVAGGVGNALHLYAGIKEPAVECSLPAGTIVDSSDPFTLSVWFKTNRPLDSCNAGATLVSFGVKDVAPLFSLGWEKRTGLAAFVRTAGRPVSEAASGRAYNDGLWHQATAVFSPDRSLDLFVDGARVASATVDAAVLQQYLAIDTFMVGKDYSGTLDQVVFVRRALTPADVVGVLNMAINPRVTDLPVALHLAFNANGVSNGTALLAAAPAPEDGGAAAAPTCAVNADAKVRFVPSTVPIVAEPFVTDQDHGVMVRLQSEDDGPVHPVFVTALPASGLVYQAKAGPGGEPVADFDSPIVHVPAATNHARSVFYVPVNETTSGEPYLFTTLGYATFDNARGLYSAEAPAHIAVRRCLYCRNARPTMEALNVTFTTYEPIAIDLTVSDLDGDVLEYVITSLPAFGRVYEVANATTGEERSLASGMVVKSPKALMYAPAELGPAAQFELQDAQGSAFFGYRILQYTGDVGSGAADGARDLMYDRIVRLTGNVREEDATHPPVSGEAGFALLFDGSGHVSVPGVSIATTVGGFSVEAWVKAPGGLTGSSSIVSTDAFALRLDRVFGCTFRLKFADVDVTVSNSDSIVYNDGLWHFFEASYDMTTARVLVDGVEVASRTMPTDATFALNGDVAVGKTFFGMLDNVAIRIGASEHTRMVDGSAPQLDLTDGATSLYLPFNDPSTGSGTVAYVAGTGVVAPFVSGMAAGSGPHFIASSAPLAGGLVTAEDTPRLFQLSGDAYSDDPAFTAGDVTARVTSLPSSGKLHQVNADLTAGEEITKALTAPTHPQNLVLFVPEEHAHNAEWAAGDASYRRGCGSCGPADSFEYVAYDSRNQRTSRVSTVDVVVVSVYDAPVMSRVDKRVELYQNEETVLRFVAKAFERVGGEPPKGTLLFKTLPRYVELFPCDAEGSKLSPLPLRFDDPGSHVTYDGEYLLVVPNLNLGGSPLDVIEVYAFDGEAESASAYTTEVHVTVNRALSCDDANKRVLTEASQAIADVLSGGSAAAYTLSFWMRSDDKASASRRRSLQSVPYQPGTLANNGAGFAEFATPSAYPGTMEHAASALVKAGAAPRDVLDAEWHHVAAAYDGELKRVYVDGKLSTAQGLLGVDASGDPAAHVAFRHHRIRSLVDLVHATASGDVRVGSPEYSGALDDVRVYNHAQEADEIRTLMEESRAPAPLPASLVYYRSFDEVEDCSVQVYQPVAGENGFALDFDGTYSLTSPPAAPTTFNATYTATVWFRVPAGTDAAGRGVLGQRNVFDVAFDAEAKLAARAFAADGTSATATSDLPVVDGNWHQLALVYDSIGTVTLMIDGKLSASATGTTPLPFQPAGGSVTTVGASGDSTPFVGTLDELALYSYAVPLSTISTRYRATQAEYPSTVLNEGGRESREGIVAIWRMNEAYGTSTVDAVSGVALSGAKASWIASTVPIARAVAGTDRMCITLYGSSEDGNVLEFFVAGVPSGGRLFATEDCATAGAEYPADAADSGVLQFAPGAVPRLLFVPDNTDEVQRPLGHLTYLVSNGRLYSKPYRLPVSVIGRNTPPVANPMTVEVFEDDSVTFDIDAYDPQGSLVTASISGPFFGALESRYTFQVPTGFVVAANEDGKLRVTYTPSKDFNGVDYFTYVAVDPEGLTSAEARVTINVTPVEDCPELDFGGVPYQTLYRKVERVAHLAAFDPDSFENPDSENTLTLSVAEGYLTLDPEAAAAIVADMEGGATAASVAGARGLARSVTIMDKDYALNAKLSNVFYVHDADAVDALSVRVFCIDGEGTTYVSDERTLELRPQDANAAVRDVRFAADGQAIEVALTSGGAAAVRATGEGCSAMLSPSTLAENKMGVGASCAVQGDVAVLRPGAGATIAPGGFVGFTAGGIADAQVATPLSPVLPRGYVQAPQVVGICEDFEVSGAQSTGGLGRDMAFLWSMPDAVVSRNLRFLVDKVSGPTLVARPGNDEFLPRVPLGTTVTVRFGAYNFLRGFLPLQVTTSVSVDDGELPTVTIFGRDVVALPPTMPLHLRAIAHPNRYCPGLVGEATSVTWVDTDSGASLGSGPVLHLPAGAVTRNPKTIRAVARRAGVQTEDTVTVRPLAGKLVAAINGAAGRSAIDWQVNANLTLSATASYDEDSLRGYNPTNEEAGWTFAYACAPLSAGASCDGFRPPASAGSASMDIAGFAMEPGTYVFTVTVSVGDGRSSAAELEVRFVDGVIPMVRLEGGLTKANHDGFVRVDAAMPFGILASPMSFEWTLAPAAGSACQDQLLPECAAAGGGFDAAKALTPLKGEVTGGDAAFAPSLYLDRKALLPGAYAVTFQASIVRDGATVSASASTVLVVDTPPVVGVVVAMASPSSAALGAADQRQGPAAFAEVVDKVGMVADLLAQAGGEVNDPSSGLRVDFGFFDATPEATFYSLTADADVVFDTARLPANASAYGVRVTNAYGSAGYATAAGVAVSPTDPAAAGTTFDGVSFEILKLEGEKDYDAALALATAAGVAITQAEDGSGSALGDQRRALVSGASLVARLLNPVFPLKAAQAVEAATSSPAALDAPARADALRFLDTAIATSLPIAVAEPLLGTAASVLAANLPTISEADYAYGASKYSTVLDKIALGFSRGDAAAPTVVRTVSRGAVSLRAAAVHALPLEADGFGIGNFVLPAGLKAADAGLGSSVGEGAISQRYKGELMTLVQKTFALGTNPYQWAPFPLYPLTSEVASLKVYAASANGGFEDAPVAPSPGSSVTVTLSRAGAVPPGSEALCVGFEAADKAWSTSIATTEAPESPLSVKCAAPKLTAFSSVERLVPITTTLPPSPPPPPPKRVREPPNPLAIVLGVLVGLLAIAAAVAALFYKRTKDAAMERMIAAAEEQEVLEVQGLVDPSAGIAPIRGPVAGPQRTSAILESDVL